jgi:hypothetical protein
MSGSLLSMTTIPTLPARPDEIGRCTDNRLPAPPAHLEEIKCHWVCRISTPMLPMLPTHP